MERVTALLPRGPQTAVLPVPHRTLEHPSFPDGMPAIIAERRPETGCVDCECLAGQIRVSRALGDEAGMLAYGWQAIRHFYVKHANEVNDLNETRQSYNSGSAS